MQDYQSGIFDEASNHHLFLEFEFHDEMTPLPSATPISEEIVAGHQVVALSATAMDHSGLSKPPSFEEFKPLRGIAGHETPATQGDLFVWLHGTQRDEIFLRSIEWVQTLQPVARLARETQGFKFRDSRDLTGFVDGSANPKDDARMEVALIPEGSCQGGSFVFLQRWKHKLAQFHTLSVSEQERVIGRTKPDSIELTGDAMPDNSHVSRTDIKREDKAVKIYRRSVPAGNPSEAGLQFIAFSAEQQRFGELLRSMYGLSEERISDNLLQYTSPLTGAYYYAPPLSHLRGLI